MTACNEGEDAYFNKVLQSALYHPRREKRIEMVYILGELRDDRALDALKAVMAEDDPYLVSEAVKATGKIGGPEAVEQLWIMMYHPSFIVRGEVALSMSDMDLPDRDKLLNQLLNDSSPYVANCAYLVLNASNVNLKRKDVQKMRFCYEKRCDQSR
jgi:HEAT repeat protein